LAACALPSPLPARGIRDGVVAHEEKVTMVDLLFVALTLLLFLLSVALIRMLSRMWLGLPCQPSSPLPQFLQEA
jgi:hypothetical protein